MSEQSVLVVEDTDEIRELVTTVLRRAGFDVREAVSGAGAWRGKRSMAWTRATSSRGEKGLAM